MNTKFILLSALCVVWGSAEAQSITGSSLYSPAAGGARVLSAQGNTAANPAIGFQSAVSNAATAQNDGGGGNGIFRPLANTMAFSTSSLERMRITQSGNVGIGTTTPSAIFHSLGTVRLEGLGASTTNTNILTTDASGNVANRTLSSMMASSGAWSVAGNSATASDFLGTLTAQPLNIRTNNTQKMTVLVNGNVGIGTAAPAAHLHIQSGTGSVKVDALDAGIELESGNDNVSFIDFKGMSNLSTDFRGRIRHDDTKGFDFFTNAGATPLHLDNNGIVGINTNTPNQPYSWQNIKLHLNGDMRFEQGGQINGYATGTTSKDALTINAVDGCWSGSYMNLYGNNSNGQYAKAGSMELYSTVNPINPNSGIFFNVVNTTVQPNTWVQNMGVYSNGKVGIGVDNWGMPGNYRLYVKDGILTEKVKVALQSSSAWADYVFAPNYKLAPLSEVETYIKANKHLPNLPSADELVKDGLDLGTMQAKQMEKIEELTLYMIEMKKEIDQLKKDNAALKLSASPSKN